MDGRTTRLKKLESLLKKESKRFNGIYYNSISRHSPWLSLLGITEANVIENAINRILIKLSNKYINKKYKKKYRKQLLDNLESARLKKYLYIKLSKEPFQKEKMKCPEFEIYENTYTKIPLA